MTAAITCLTWQVTAERDVYRAQTESLKRDAETLRSDYTALQQAQQQDRRALQALTRTNAELKHAAATAKAQAQQLAAELKQAREHRPPPPPSNASFAAVPAPADRS